MEIFISWSGERSKAIAESLKEWLPKVIQALEPWISVSDIDKGTQWFSEISEKLKEVSFGIVCLTPENINSPWILFESGAITKAFGKSFVCPVLFEFEKSDLSGPLSGFNLTKYEKHDMFNLIQTINKNLPQKGLSDNQLKESFNLWWPKLEEKIATIPSPKEKEVIKRSDRELLEEILNVVRNIGRLYDLADKTREALQSLESSEENFLRDRFGLGVTPKTKEEIANNLGINMEELDEMEANILRKLRQPKPQKLKLKTKSPTKNT